MNDTAFATIPLIAQLTLAGQILAGTIAVLFLTVRVFKVKSRALETILSFIETNSLSFAFLVASSATLGSLFLSEIVHFIPCKLCWYQRIFMYPQTIILGVALVTNDLTVRKYILILSAIGLLIALYHIALQNYPGILPCSDEVANCALKQFTYFGYITIPVMSATAFALVFLLALLQQKKS